MKIYPCQTKKKKGQVTGHRNLRWPQIISSLEWKIMPPLALQTIFFYFIGHLKFINDRLVKGYVLYINVREEVMVKMKIEDYEGQIHSIIIQNVNYFPKASI